MEDSVARSGPARGPFPAGGILRRFFLTMLFLVLPLFLALFGSRILFGGDQGKLEAEAATRLDEVLGEIESNKDPDRYFSRLFRRVENRVFSDRNPPMVMKRIAGFLKRRFPGQIQIVFTDADGRSIPGLADRQIPRILANKFRDSYLDFLTRKQPLSETAAAFVKSFMGSFVSLARETHGNLQFASGDPDPAFLYYSRPREQGMFYLFFRPRRSLELLALEEVIRAQCRRTPEISLAPGVRGESLAEPAARLGVPARARPGLWKRLQRSGTGKVRAGNRLVGRRILFPGLWILGSISCQGIDPNSGNSLPLPAAFVLLTFLAFLGAAVFSPERLLGSVRVKLLVIFLYTALVPLIIMGVTARRFLDERRQVLENETHQQAETAIRTFDGQVSRFKANLGEQVAEHQFAPGALASDAFADLKEQIDQYRRKYRFDFCRVFDPLGKLAFASYDPRSPTVIGGPLKIWPAFARKMFRTYCPEAVARAVGSGTPGTRSSEADALLEGMFTRTPFSTLEDVEIAKLAGWFGTLPLQGPGNLITHVVFLVWLRETLEAEYIRDHLLSFARGQNMGEMVSWSQDSPDTLFPPASRYGKVFQSVQGFVTSRATSFRRIVQWEDEPILLTGLRGTMLQGFTFLMATPYRRIQGELDRLAWNGGYLTMAVLVMCLLVSFLLARHFLEPLGNLTRGLEAISRRDFQATIPVLADDELGRLAGSFNNTLGDLQDLEVARTLQESLFPNRVLSTGGWEVFGTCLPATQVGGDYIDYLSLPGNRILIVIGDVSGHGVGAGLVVAMAKVMVTQLSSGLADPGSPPDPLPRGPKDLTSSSSSDASGLLTALNQLLLGVVRKKKMMSCCLAVLSPDRRQLDLANAGHCAPLLIGQQSSSFPDLRSYPLGSTRNWKPALASFPLQPGAAVIFYTDGLVEAQDLAGMPVGYDRFRGRAPFLVGKSALQTEAAVRSWHRSLTGGGTPDDDVSLIIVQESDREGGHP